MLTLQRKCTDPLEIFLMPSIPSKETKLQKGFVYTKTDVFDIENKLQRMTEWKTMVWAKTPFTGYELVVDVTADHTVSLTVSENIRPLRKRVSSFLWLLSVQNSFTSSLKHTKYKYNI